MAQCSGYGGYRKITRSSNAERGCCLDSGPPAQPEKPRSLLLHRYTLAGIKRTVGVDSRSTVPAWDPLSDSRVSFDEGFIRDLRTHTAALEWMCRRGLTVLPCRKVTSATLVKLGVDLQSYNRVKYRSSTGERLQLVGFNLSVNRTNDLSLPSEVRAKKPSLTLNLGTNGLKVTSEPPPMAKIPRRILTDSEASFLILSFLLGGHSIDLSGSIGEEVLVKIELENQSGDIN
ncbi:hypothetical protein J6590_070305 [Homalodisca vitripennis]|nr:hypothetical protein J6590_070305 [Homalodisca vitripennis]